MKGRGRPLAWRPVSPFLAVLVLALLPTVAAAQADGDAGEGGEAEAVALRKSDVIRLLAEPQPAAEVSEIVSRRCLSFRPTDRDLRDFRAMGAGEAVMEAIEACSDGAGAAPASDDESESELTLFLDPRRVRAAPGEVVRIRAEVSAGAVPAADVPLELRGTSSGQDTPVHRAVTGADGTAVLDLTAPEGRGTHRFILLSPARNLEGANLLEIEVAARAADGGEEAEEATADEATGEEEVIATGGRGDGEESAEEATPPLADLLERADVLSRSGQYGRATVLYERALAEDPDHVETLLDYGLHLARTGAHEEAERRVERARRIAPERTDVRRTLGMLALWRGEPDLAVTWLRPVLREEPEDAEAWAALARALAETGRRDEAREARRRAEALRGG